MNKIGDAGVSAIILPLMSKTEPISLFLSGNEEKQQDIRQEGEKKRNNNLTDNEIGKSGIKLISEGLKNNIPLVHLDLGSDIYIKPVEERTTIKCINRQHNQYSGGNNDKQSIENEHNTDFS